MTDFRANAPGMWPALSALVFVLLLATVFAHIWFGTTPAPLGGPNVILAVLTVLLALVYAGLRLFQNAERAPLLQSLRPVLPVLAVSLLLVLWELAVYLFTDTLDGTRMGQVALGVGLLFAVYLSVDSVHRARWMALALIFATFVSTLFGAAIVLIGGPFLDVWPSIATVRDLDVSIIFTQGRIAGLVPITGIFAYQLAVAIPLAFAALLFDPFGRGERGTVSPYMGALYVFLMIMSTALVINGTRSVIIGLVVTGLLILASALRIADFRRRLAFLLPAIALWMLVFFNPVYTIGDFGDTIGGLFGVDDSPAAESPAPGSTAGAAPAGTAPAGTDAIAGLAAGLGGLGNAAAPPTLGYTIEQLTPEQGYELRLRTPDSAPSAPLAAAADGQGRLSFTWPQPPGHASGDAYEYQLRPAGREQWPPWAAMCSSGACGYASSRGPLLDSVAAGDVVGRANTHAISGLAAGQEYEAQLRARNADGFGPAGQSAGAASVDGSLSLAWNESGSEITGYQFRLRAGAEGEWGPWRDFAPGAASEYGVPPPRLNKIGIGLRTLQDRTEGQTVGARIEALRPASNYAVEVRAVNAYGFGPPEELSIVTADDGAFTFTWLNPVGPESVTGYQYRLRPAAEADWGPWQDYQPTLNSHDPQDAAEVQRLLEETTHIDAVSQAYSGADSGRVFSLADWSARVRIASGVTALRYSLENPLGHPEYTPDESHISGDFDSGSIRSILTFLPHNQFLHMLVIFGYPGLLLLVLFYLLALWSAWRSGLLAWRSQDGALYFLAAGVIGAFAAYSIASLFHPLGPFIVEWSHFLVVGLLFSLQRIASEQAG